MKRHVDDQTTKEEYEARALRAEAALVRVRAKLARTQEALQEARIEAAKASALLDHTERQFGLVVAAQLRTPSEFALAVQSYRNSPPPDELSRVAERLVQAARLVKQDGLSQAEACRRTKVNTASLSRLLSGKNLTAAGRVAQRMLAAESLATNNSPTSRPSTNATTRAWGQVPASQDRCATALQPDRNGCNNRRLVPG